MTTSRLSPTTYLTHLEGDLDRLDALLAGVRERTWRSPVPACSGWTLAHLIRHLGGVHRMVIAAIERQEASKSGQYDPGALAEDELRGWLRDGGRRMLELLRADPADPAWSFFRPDQTVGFWQRRQAQEHLVHRYDAETALGCPTPLSADLAADGIGEIVEVMVPLREGRAVTLPPYAVRFVASDTGQDWLIGTGPVSGTARGTAADLLLALWGRRDPARALAVEGDTEAVRRMLTLALVP